MILHYVIFDLILHDIISYKIIHDYNIVCYDTLYYILWSYMTLYYILLCDIILYSICSILYYIILYYIVLYYMRSLLYPYYTIFFHVLAVREHMYVHISMEICMYIACSRLWSLVVSSISSTWKFSNSKSEKGRSWEVSQTMKA